MATQHKSKSSDHADHLRDITGAGAEQSREFLQKVGNVTSEAANAMQNCCSTGLKGMQEYHSKLLELTQRNAQSYFDFAQKLAVAKTPAQFFEMSTEHTRHQFEALAAQTQELAALAQRIAVATAEPVRESVARVSERAA